MGRFVNLSSDFVESRYDFISSIVLKEHSRDATETGNVNRIWSAIACSFIFRKLKHFGVGIELLQISVLFTRSWLIKRSWEAVESLFRSSETTDIFPWFSAIPELPEDLK
jgi:hypothetical protein